MTLAQTKNTADIVGLQTAGIGEATLTQAAKIKADKTLELFLDYVDGIYAAAMGDCRIVATVGSNKLWGSTIHNATASNETIAQFLRSSGVAWTVRGGVEAATAAGDFGAFVGLSRGNLGAARAAVWESGQMIRDPYSSKNKGEIELTLQLSLAVRNSEARKLETPQVRRLAMETGAVWPLELRQVGNVLTGTFPYGKLAVIASTGRVRKERFEARAFAFAVASAVREVHLLVGHDYNKPLARKLNGSLILNDSDEALEFRATLPPEADRPDVHDGCLGATTGRADRWAESWFSGSA